jgi:hypothetical protein
MDNPSVKSTPCPRIDVIHGAVTIKPYIFTAFDHMARQRLALCLAPCAERSRRNPPGERFYAARETDGPIR